MKEIYYWSPCLSKVGTVSSTINSAIGLSKYGKYKVKIINACGEWDAYKKKFSDNKIDVIDFPIKIFKYLPKEGFLNSRVSYLIIFLFSFFPLIKLLKKKSPEFLVIHLITSLPLFLLILFKFNTKFILRISGLPKLNILRGIFWRSLSRKVYKVTTPTIGLLNYLDSKNIFKKQKLFYLPDAMINLKDFVSSKYIKEDVNNKLINESYFIAVGRLTRQKNFNYLINEFYDFSKINSEYKLLIFGNGEEKKILHDQIKRKKLSNRIFLMGFSNNIDFYMKKSSAFILSSLWEEPGAVLIEAALNNTFIISSDCPYGPSEFLESGKFGSIYKSNAKNELAKKLLEFANDKGENKKKRIGAKRNCFKYTMFRHYLNLTKILNSD